MRLDLGGTPNSKRSLARAAIAALGLAALIGSGGGSAPECSFFSNSCNIGPIVFPPIPYASIEPERVTVQVGATVVFNARSGSVVQPSYRWCRTPAGATVCTEIVGATGASYTLVGANLADDGTQLKVTVSDPNGTAFAVSQLAVSSLPGVVIRDGDFGAADWTASATLVPPLNGPSYVGSSPARGATPARTPA